MRAARLLLLALAFLLTLAGPALAQQRTTVHGYTKKNGTYVAPHTRGAPHTKAPETHAPGARDAKGRLERSESAKRSFERLSGHPKGWPGHVVDHIVPLDCGGADAPSNMQWQTTAEAKTKDKVERRSCSSGRRP